jgi:hypothetical protein
MNLIPLGIAVFLFSVKRTILFDRPGRKIVLIKRSIFRKMSFCAGYDEVTALRFGADHVYSGFALSSSSAAETYSVPSLRLVLNSGGTVLLDRGGKNRLENLAERLASFIDKRLERQAEERLQK